jgi:hypothetical protein
MWMWMSHMLPWCGTEMVVLHLHVRHGRAAAAAAAAAAAFFASTNCCQVRDYLWLT